MDIFPENAQDSRLGRAITRRGVLWVGLKCDIRCKFCYDSQIRNTDKTWMTMDEVREALYKYRKYYRNSYVDLMGGEPTLHPKILSIIEFASDLGLKPTVVTHGMHLSESARVEQYIDAGVNDFLVSIHGTEKTVKNIHGKDIGNFTRQMQCLNNLKQLNVPFRINCTVIKDNVNELDAIVDIAVEKGAKVVNFLTFNPYFEWSDNKIIDFQVRHSEAASSLVNAIDKCTQNGIEVNVRYMPICQLPGKESHVYTGFQLPYDTHEWDYNSWYDYGCEYTDSKDWYLQASRKQRERHHYTYVSACKSCSVREICDGFHAQYIANYGDKEAKPYEGEAVTDPTHFIKNQYKMRYSGGEETIFESRPQKRMSALDSSQFSACCENRAGIKMAAKDKKSQL